MNRMRRLISAVVAGLLLAAGACDGDAPVGDGVSVPSGRDVQVLDVITDAPGPKGATARFRFVLPGLTAGEDVTADMEALCNSYALPRIGAITPLPQQIVMIFADQAVPFGEVSPDAVQFFEAYSVKNGACIWEMF